MDTPSRVNDYLITDSVHVKYAVHDITERVIRETAAGFTFMIVNLEAY